MRTLFVFLTALFFFSLTAEENSIQQENFKSFTGKVTRNKVRLRLQPSLESRILREYNKGDLLIVTADRGEFYAVKPPEDFKGYVFRTFVLDNVVEGNRVNIRLEPDLEALVIGQLTKGAQVNGNISPLNSKWLEIALPEDVEFYISKEYVENIGDASLIHTTRKRLDEVNTLLTQAQNAAQDQLQKPFVQIDLDPIYIRLNKVVNQFSEFPDQVAKAKDLLKEVQEQYLRKKISYLEEKSKFPDQPAQASQTDSKTITMPGTTPKMAAWIPVEALLYEAWAKEHGQGHGQGTIEDFYTDQRQNAIVLTGVIEPYIRSVHNKPGDYMLIAKKNRLPSAYLYSTLIDLQKKVGQEATIIAAPRSNSNFAFPAYFVLAIE